MSRSHFTSRPTTTKDSRGLTEADCLAEAMRHGTAYPECSESTPIALHETHVSQVFLAGDHAYKIKKPVTTSFLDYGTLEKRRDCCEREYRLNRRFAADLYLGVVPITSEQGHIRVEGQGAAIEFAVKMRRFPDDALLSHQLAAGKIVIRDVVQLASTLAEFHQQATIADPSQRWGSRVVILQEAQDNFPDVRVSLADVPAADSWTDLVDQVQSWTDDAGSRLASAFETRRAQGWIRECHGDLHADNVLRWNGTWIPFDGIEFNEELRWIDVLSDAAFLAMDFAARNRLDLGRCFLNAYLEKTGDYEALAILKWYLVYRAMVRAKVAAIRSRQGGQSQADQQHERRESVDHVKLASQFTLPSCGRLWITHGVSGSGKTTGTEYLIKQHGAIRLRSDVERKRLLGIAPSQRPDGELKQLAYSDELSQQTYERLRTLAQGLLRDGESVVIDATFLKRRHREMFQALASQQGVALAIVPFSAEASELERRIRSRAKANDDASDADLRVLQSQFDRIEPLSDSELELAERPQPDPDQTP